MSLSNMSANAIARELGERFKQARLNANLTQKELARRTGLSTKAIVNTEAGTSKLATIVTIMMTLGLTDQLNLFIPKQEISPIQLAKLKGKERQRASSPRNNEKNDSKESLKW